MILWSKNDPQPQEVTEAWIANFDCQIQLKSQFLHCISIFSKVSYHDVFKFSLSFP